MLSNRFVLVPRERVQGAIEGHDFGYGLSVLVRSPRAILMWNAGTAYTSGRRTCYGTSGLILFDDRRSHVNCFGRLRYRSLGEDGGRLSLARITGEREPIAKTFGDDAWEHVVAAIRARSTLVIEGGGGRLHPRLPASTPFAEAQAILDDWKRDRLRGFLCG